MSTTDITDSPWPTPPCLRDFSGLTDEQRRIPLIDARRIHKFGWCQGRKRGQPCSETSYLDDTHSAGCPLKSTSTSWLELVLSG